MMVSTWSELMLTSLTAPVLRSWAAFFTCPSTAAYSISVDWTSRSFAASTWKLSTEIPSKPMTEQASAPSTERTTSSSRGRKAIGSVPTLRRGDDAAHILIASGDAAGAPAERLARGKDGGAVQRGGRAAIEGQGEADLVGVLRASRQPPEVLQGDHERLGRAVDRC